MTEPEWIASCDPIPMLDFLNGNVSDRQLRLLAVACCRRIAELITDPVARQAVAVGERYADGLATEDERLAYAGGKHFQPGEHTATLASALGAVNWTVDGPLSTTVLCWCVGHAVNASVRAALARGRGTWFAPPDTGVKAGAAADLCDIVGPRPFRPVAFNEAWLTANVTDLAQAIYDDRAFDRLPILADALEDAGCTNRDILDHCRQPGEHVRGCWIVDLALKKE